MLRLTQGKKTEVVVGELEVVKFALMLNSRQ